MRDRAAFVALASACGAVLGTARALTPSPSGVGTHVALGLAPCAFLQETGLPCPTCGLTTAFAHLARGALSSSLSAHPLGVPLLLSTALAVPWALAHALRGTRFVQALSALPLSDGSRWLVLTLLVAWLARLLALVSSR